MARDDEKIMTDAQKNLRRGIERSRQVVARYRARLLVLRQAIERQQRRAQPGLHARPRTRSMG